MKKNLLFFDLNNVYHIFKIILSVFILNIIQSVLLTHSVVALENFNRLEHIDFSTMPGNRVQIQLNFSSTPITPQTFSTDNPARIVLDFSGAKLGLKKKSQAIGIGLVQSTSAVEAHDRIRVVLNLVRMVPFDVQVVGNRVLVTVENIGAQSTLPKSGGSFTTPMPLKATVPQVSTKPMIPTVPFKPTTPLVSYEPNTPSVPFTPSVSYEPSPPKPQGAYIQDIDFRRTQDGAGRITIVLSEPTIMVDMRQKGTKIVLNFSNINLPSKLDRRLDVQDFGTPISFIDTSPLGSHVRMNIIIADNSEYHAYQRESIYVVEVKEKVVVKAEETKIEERKYEGQLVSFNFQNIEVRAALSLLFDLPGVNLNMVAGDDVKGSVTLRLKNIPWDQALDIILEARGLGMRKIGNVVMIDLKKNIDERKQRELTAQKKIKELEPLYTEFITVNYAKAKDVASLLQTRGDHSFLSKQGSVSMDERTNTLIIQDTATKIGEVRRLISSLDTPVRQVLIEARIVIANSNFSKSLGVKFGHSANQDLGQGNGVVFGGKVGGDTNFSGGTGFTSDTTMVGEGQGENFIVSLPAIVDAGSPASLGLAIGKIGSYLLQLELSAMQSEGSGEIVSSPRIITGNQQEAIIIQGTEIPYVQMAGVGSVAQVQFKPAVLELKVTPQITPDDRISMELSVKKDSEGKRINGNVSIDKREVKTNILIDNGETVVLGGVYERTMSNTLERVPFFADLPFIGNLFKRKSSRDEKSELLIFVTPKIIKETT
ncbi:type IV pilus secretin PilQ [Candidatus Parabeggiatoa sp. HSG14]|uniref:type IV pilus secretin PilQ n=1 Tax=Candidatus Parabeggiatoa sp. HSG14 TaxID=3055593 RepID=UPI0025A8DF2F|nr:type IV pilus secretin PilQ [Thiotrichales bacterium HSG14]